MQKYIIFQYSNVAHSNLLNMKCATYWRTRISFLFIIILHYFFNGNWYRKKKISFCLWNDNFASCIKIEMKIRVLLSAEVLFAILLHCVSFYYYYYVNVGFCVIFRCNVVRSIHIFEFGCKFVYMSDLISYFGTIIPWYNPEQDSL